MTHLSLLLVNGDPIVVYFQNENLLVLSLPLRFPEEQCIYVSLITRGFRFLSALLLLEIINICPTLLTGIVFIAHLANYILHSKNLESKHQLGPHQTFSFSDLFPSVNLVCMRRNEQRFLDDWLNMNRLLILVPMAFWRFSFFLYLYG